jgi:hypothetical protein
MSSRLWSSIEEAIFGNESYVWNNAMALAVGAKRGTNRFAAVISGAFVAGFRARAPIGLRAPPLT